jgi:hypothetical protein
MIHTFLSENKMTEEIEKFNRLKNWTLDNGAELGNFEIKYLSYSNRFVVASQDIKNGETIMNIPYKLIFTPDKPEIISECAKYNFTEVDCYPLYLSLEKQNNQSFYKPFLDYLPTDFSSYPSFYNIEILNYSNGSILMDYYDQYEKYFQNNYNKIKVKNFIILIVKIIFRHFTISLMMIIKRQVFFTIQEILMLQKKIKIRLLWCLWQIYIILIQLKLTPIGITIIQGNILFL